MTEVFLVKEKKETYYQNRSLPNADDKELKIRLNAFLKVCIAKYKASQERKLSKSINGNHENFNDNSENKEYLYGEDAEAKSLSNHH